MTAAQQGGNTHSILWPSRVLTSLPWQRRLMLWQVWFALDRNTATGLASPRVLVSSTVYKPVIFTHTHTYPYALHMQLNYILTVWARGELPGCEAPCWPLCSSRLKWDEAVWGTETVQIHVELNILHLSLFFLSSVDSPLTPHDSLSYAGSQAKSSLKIGWNRCDFKSQPLL